MEGDCKIEERRQTDRCRRELAAIEAELLAGNPDVTGLLLGFADWHAELRILQNEKRRQALTRRRLITETADAQALTE
ncbi:MAG TPA: hypothetical protein VGQ49_04685 [Bryobacteraceae bacterium]|jgi:hypothetical protein|nr:hypothetical protein [Bryobacteraceae bacterium]